MRDRPLVDGYQDLGNLATNGYSNRNRSSKKYPFLFPLYSSSNEYAYVFLPFNMYGNLGVGALLLYPFIPNPTIGTGVQAAPEVITTLLVSILNLR